MQSATNYEQRKTGERHLAEFQRAGALAGIEQQITGNPHKVVHLERELGEIEFGVEGTNRLTGETTVTYIIGGDPTLYEKFVECRERFDGSFEDWKQERGDFTALGWNQLKANLLALDMVPYDDSPHSPEADAAYLAHQASIGNPANQSR